MILADGTTAPPFSMKAEVSQRTVSLGDTPGKLLLIFNSYQTVDMVGKVIGAVRAAYPGADHVLIAAVSDMRIVPRLLRGAAKAFIKNAYNDAAKQIPSGEDPADHIIILADWNGALFDAYQVPATNKEVALVLIGAAKTIEGSYHGADAAETALALLAGDQLAGTA